MRRNCIGYLALFLGILISASRCVAQDSLETRKIQIGISPSVYFPGTNLEFYGVGIGGELTVLFPLENPFSINVGDRFWFVTTAGVVNFGTNDREYPRDTEGERGRKMVHVGAGVLYQEGLFFVSPSAYYLYSFETIEFNRVPETRVADLLGVKAQVGVLFRHFKLSTEINFTMRGSGSFGAKLEGWYGLTVAVLL